ncbi:MAG: fibrobacter succinogenes major paralogous domain-containing protein, partial [Flavobacteriales bacterium]
SFNAASGGQVSLENVTIDFTPGSIALNGQPYSGNVHVAINSIDPSDTWNMSQQMPGSLVGANGQQFDVLRSLGMAGVELTDDSGQELQLLSGNTATVRFEVPASLQANAPSTIPLWHYSESQGYWVREGEAALNGNVYEGEVSHFSFWNCDIPAEAVMFTLTLLDDAHGGSANPIEGAHVVITSTVFGPRDGYANSNGVVSGLIPANEVLEVNVYIICGNSEVLVFTASIGPLTTDYSATWSITDLPNVALVQGQLLNASGTPVAGYVYLESGGFVSTEDGSYELLACTGSDAVSGWYYEGTDICTSNTIVVNLNTGINEYDIQILDCFSISQPGEGVTDIDGNFYPSIIIAEQEWMVSNLRTTRYANGDLIPELQDGALWDNTTDGAWCNYANDNSLDIVFGKLYNGYAVLDNRNVCPTGWHVPSEEEVDSMLFVLDPETELYSEIAGGMLKQEGNIDDGNGLWAYPNEGASNASGFAAVPGGWRIEGFGFSEGDSLAAILTRPQSLANPPDQFSLLMMEYSNTQGGLFGSVNIQGGGSIRCVRD